MMTVLKIGFFLKKTFFQISLKNKFIKNKTKINPWLLLFINPHCRLEKKLPRVKYSFIRLPIRFFIANNFR